jgi:hypothetical protein
MKSKMMASRQYAANQFGMTNGDPKKKKKDQEGEGMSCSEHGCSAYNAGGGKSNTGSSKYNVKTSSGSKGESNKVLSKKQADKRAEQFAKNRAKAAAANKPKSKF